MPCAATWMQVNPGKFGTGLALRKIGVHTQAMAPTSYSNVLARNLRAARSRIGLGQESVAERMRALGYEAWLRQTVGATERGRRRPTAEEILGLALALETTIARTDGRSDQDDKMELPAEVHTIGAVSVERLAGRGVNDRSVTWRDPRWRRTARYLPGVESVRLGATRAAGLHGEAGQVASRTVCRRRDRHIGRSACWWPPQRRQAALDVHRWRAGARRAPEDTAVREVKEETGLRVQAGHVIGERVHPKTGRHMIYLAARPVRGTDVFVGDEEELAEVRWVSLAEADELLPGMYEPVREYLAQELGGTEG